jgi:hypothetical protein
VVAVQLMKLNTVEHWKFRGLQKETIIIAPYEIGFWIFKIIFQTVHRSPGISKDVHNLISFGFGKSWAGRPGQWLTFVRESWSQKDDVDIPSFRPLACTYIIPQSLGPFRRWWQEVLIYVAK